MYPPLLRQRVKTICIFQLGGGGGNRKRKWKMKKEREKKVLCVVIQLESLVCKQLVYKKHHFIRVLIHFLSSSFSFFFIGIPHIPENVDKIRLSRGCPGGVWQLSKGKGKLLSLEPASEVPVIHHSLIFSPFIRIICPFILLSINYCFVGPNNYAINDRHLRLRSEIIKS